MKATLSPWKRLLEAESRTELTVSSTTSASTRLRNFIFTAREGHTLEKDEAWFIERSHDYQLVDLGVEASYVFNANLTDSLKVFKAILNFLALPLAANLIIMIAWEKTSQSQKLPNTYASKM
ncbi:hypothetical protein MG293_009868 [Ovis ammon polii]|uniref:Uncharacterized protein n=1 Tax=Ovis ammon polii TaxID=230172 RepID=A0AAD4U6I3_OVIAM|nr:hypothetical protein MG293_009868 [Ovis ammon polii]